VKEVGILLKVGASGLENIDKLGAGLRDAGVDTQALDKVAVALKDELDTLNRKLTDTTAATTALAGAENKAETEAKTLAARVQELEAEYVQLDRQLDTAAKSAAEVAAAQAKAAAEARALAAAAREAANAVQVEVSAIDVARQRMQAADAAVDAYRASLGDLTKAEKDEVAQLDLLAERSRTARVAYLDQVTNASAAARALDAVTTSSDKAGRASKDNAAAANEAAGATRNQGAAADEAGGKLGGLVGQLRNLTALDLALKVGGELKNLVGDVSQTAEAFQNMQARIKLVTGTGEEFTVAMQGIEAIALRTNTNLEATAGLYTRIAQAGKELGVGQHVGADRKLSHFCG
jgi:chromosome segregation ATPase